MNVWTWNPWEIMDIKYNSPVKLQYGVEVYHSLLIEQGFIEEVKETPKPRWKVGDKIVREYHENIPPDYLQIFSVGKYGINWISWVYNNDVDYKEESLRDPTPEELSTYFK